MMSRTSRTSSARTDRQHDRGHLLVVRRPVAGVRRTVGCGRPTNRTDARAAAARRSPRGCARAAASRSTSRRDRSRSGCRRGSRRSCTAASARTSGRCSRRTDHHREQTDQDAVLTRDRDADDHRDDHHDEEHRRPGEQHRRDQASGVHLDDARRVHGGGVELRREELADTVLQHAVRVATGRLLVVLRAGGEHEDALPEVVRLPAHPGTRAARWRRCRPGRSRASPSRRSAGPPPRDVDALDPVEPRLRWLRNSTPERTSTTSPVTRNSCIRQDTVKSPKTTAGHDHPEHTQPTAPSPDVADRVAVVLRCAPGRRTRGAGPAGC